MPCWQQILHCSCIGVVHVHAAAFGRCMGSQPRSMSVLGCQAAATQAGVHMLQLVVLMLQSDRPCDDTISLVYHTHFLLGDSKLAGEAETLPMTVLHPS